MTAHETASEHEDVFNPAAARGQAAFEAPANDTGAAPETEALLAEVAGLKDKMLRSLADMENLRRRTEREVADARMYGVTSFARDMLTVADNLRRALDSVPADNRATADGPLKALVEGIELTERDFLATLSRYGVKKLEPLGQKFDPNMHQAMFEIPDETVPSGTVLQVVQAGFAIGERVLRPALVGVSRGGPKVGTAPPAG
jgi:molecular chaperone GrpE